MIRLRLISVDSKLQECGIRHAEDWCMDAQIPSSHPSYIFVTSVEALCWPDCSNFLKLACNSSLQNYNICLRLLPFSSAAWLCAAVAWTAVPLQCLRAAKRLRAECEHQHFDCCATEEACSDLNSTEKIYCKIVYYMNTMLSMSHHFILS